jgi:hypothetical protein
MDKDFLKLPLSTRFIYYTIHLKLKVYPADAVTQAIFTLMEWLVEKYELSQRGAHMQISVNPGVKEHINQMIPDMFLLSKAGVEFPREGL